MQREAAAREGGLSRSRDVMHEQDALSTSLWQGKAHALMTEARVIHRVTHRVICHALMNEEAT